MNPGRMLGRQRRCLPPSRAPLDGVRAVGSPAVEAEEAAVLIIHAEQVVALARAEVNGFEDRMVLHLAEVIPETTSGLGEAELRAQIQQGLDRAARWGIAREYDLALYLQVMFALGPGFEEAPSYAWARDLLDAAGRGASSRVDALHDRVFDPEHADAPIKDGEDDDEPSSAVATSDAPATSARPTAKD